MAAASCAKRVQEEGVVTGVAGIQGWVALACAPTCCQRAVSARASPARSLLGFSLPAAYNQFVIIFSQAVSIA